MINLAAKIAPSAIVNALLTWSPTGIDMNQTVCPCDAIASITLMLSFLSFAKDSTAFANVSPSCTLTSDISSGLVALFKIIFITRFFMGCGSGTSPYCEAGDDQRSTRIVRL